MTNEYEKFFDLSLDMLAILNSEGRFRKINRAFSKNLGWELQDLQGKDAWDLVIPGEELTITSISQNLDKGHPLILLKSQVKCQDGSLSSLRWSAYPDLDEHRIYLIIREETPQNIEQEVFKQALEASPTGVLIVARGKIKYTNILVERIFGYPQRELVEKPIEMLLPSRFQESHFKSRSHYENHPHLRGMGTELELTGRRKDGSEFSLDIGLNPIHTPDGLMVVCSIIDNTEGKTAKINYAQKIQELENEISILGKLSLIDELTAVNNRRAFFKQLELQYHIAQKENRPFSLVLIDIDNFKDFNDTFGHVAGDRVLRTIAEIMTRSVRHTEVVARYGGEEFGMILPYTDAHEAGNLVERLRKMIEEYEWPMRKITISAGTATVSPNPDSEFDQDDLNNFIIMADRALYHSKSSGKNQVTNFCDLPIHLQENLSNWKIHHETPTDN